jgi:hypothetical protein
MDRVRDPVDGQPAFTGDHGAALDAFLLRKLD